MNINSIKKIDYYLGYFLIVAFSPINLFFSKLIDVMPARFFKKKLIFFKLVGGGSLVIAAPSIYSIRKKYKNHKFVLYCSESVKPFAEKLGIFDEILCIRMRRADIFILTILGSMRRIFMAEIFINLEMHSKLSALFCLWSFSKKRVGFYSAYNQLQTNLVNFPIYRSERNPLYESYRNLCDLLEAPRLKFSTFQNFFNRFNNPNAVKKIPIKNQILIAPYCSDIYPERELNVNQIKEIVLKNYDLAKYTFILLGSPKDLSRSIFLEKSLSITGANICNMVGKTSFEEVIFFLRSSRELLTIDSGILFIARLIGIKTLSFWGPSDPETRLEGPLENDTIFYKKISCSPCVHTLDTSPCSGNNLCIKQHFGSIPKNILWKIK